MKNNKKGTASRLVKTMFEFYPVLLPVTLVCVLFSAVVSSVPSVFMQKVIAIVETYGTSGDWAAAKPKVTSAVTTLICLYVLCAYCRFSL